MHWDNDLISLILIQLMLDGWTSMVLPVMNGKIIN